MASNSTIFKAALQIADVDRTTTRTMRLRWRAIHLKPTSA